MIAFLDTSGLLAFADDTEPRHHAAKVIFKSLHRAYIHSYVLAEFVTLANVRGLDRRKSLRFAESLLTIRLVDTTWVDETLHLEAMDLLLARLDKSYSLCDAVSFILMRRFGIADALTTDHHFEQEGFQRLLMPA